MPRVRLRLPTWRIRFVFMLTKITSGIITVKYVQASEEKEATQGEPTK